MKRFDKLVGETQGPVEWASYSGSSDEQELRLKQLDIIAKSAFDNLRAYSNCTRSVVFAIQTHLRLPDTSVLKTAATMAGGIAGTGETCGTVLGGLMAIGQALGSDGAPSRGGDATAKAAAKAFVDVFLSEIGSTTCYGVQEAVIGWRCDESSKEPAWREAGGPVGCAGVCAFAARQAASEILNRLG